MVVRTIGEALQRATQAAFTRPIPATTAGQTRYLLRRHGGSTKDVARLLGVTPRTVQRYAAGQIKTPKPSMKTKLADEVRRRWQPLVQKRARAAAARNGAVIEVRARFGFTAAPGSTDDARIRHITQVIDPAAAQRLIDAHQRGAPEQELQRMAADALGGAYFRDGGTRAAGLAVEFTDVEHLEIGI